VIILRIYRKVFKSENFNMVKMIKKSRRGISPVIATVLLIAIVLILGTIIFLWARGWIIEKQTKFGSSIDLVCEDVELDASVDTSTDMLSVDNTGGVSVYALEVLADDGDDRLRYDCGEQRIFAGSSKEIDLANCKNEDNESPSADNVVSVFPVLLDDDDELYVCEDEIRV